MAESQADGQPTDRDSTDGLEEAPDNTQGSVVQFFEPDTSELPAGTYPPPDASGTPSVMEAGADLSDYELTEADRRLDSVYGDHVHANVGRHLDGGVESDKEWQSLWRSVVGLPLSPYRVPKGRIGRRFVKLLTHEFAQVRLRQCNSERPLVFAAVILQKSIAVTRATDIRRRLEQRMDLWEKGSHQALIDDIKDELGRRVRVAPRQESEADAFRRFNSTVLHGYLRKAVRGLTNRDGGGVLGPTEACTKTGRPVIDVLREKHPLLRDPDLSGPNPGAFESYGDSAPEVVPENES